MGDVVPFQRPPSKMTVARGTGTLRCGCTKTEITASMAMSIQCPACGDLLVIVRDQR